MKRAPGPKAVPTLPTQPLLKHSEEDISAVRLYIFGGAILREAPKLENFSAFNRVHASVAAGSYLDPLKRPTKFTVLLMVF